MSKAKRMYAIISSLINGSAVVIVKQGENDAKVYCGRQIDREFMVRSMTSTIKSLLKKPMMAN